MTGTVCNFHISAVDHLLIGESLFSGAVVCTRLRRSLCFFTFFLRKNLWA
jgi:hypothetical protein